MAGHQKNTKFKSWRPIINRTVVNILLHKNMQWNNKEKKLTDREQHREQQEA